MDEVEVKVKLADLNPHLVCSLCAGYLIDATTITECLHTFCKSCIVRHLQNSKCCPHCNQKVHETQPLQYLKLDRTLQDIIFKLVPGLFEEEEKRKAQFKKLRENSVSSGRNVSDRKKAYSPTAHHFCNDKKVAFCLERRRFFRCSLSLGEYELPVLEEKFIRTSERALIDHVIKLVQRMLDIPSYLEINIYCGVHNLPYDWCLKRVKIQYWSNKLSPLMLCYDVKPTDSYIKEHGRLFEYSYKPKKILNHSILGNIPKVKVKPEDSEDEDQGYQTPTFGGKHNQQRPFKTLRDCLTNKRPCGSPKNLLNDDKSKNGDSSPRDSAAKNVTQSFATAFPNWLRSLGYNANVVSEAAGQSSETKSDNAENTRQSESDNIGNSGSLCVSESLNATSESPAMSIFQSLDESLSEKRRNRTSVSSDRTLPYEATLESGEDSDDTVEMNCTDLMNS